MTSLWQFFLIYSSLIHLHCMQILSRVLLALLVEYSPEFDFQEFSWRWNSHYKIFSQCAYVRMCLSRSGMSIYTHVHTKELYVMCAGEYRMPSLGLAKEDREERRFLTMEVEQRGWSSTMYVFCEVEYWTQPTVCGIAKMKATKSRYSRS